MSMVIGSVINLKIHMRTLERQHPIKTPKTFDVKYNTQENRKPTESCCCVNQHDDEYSIPLSPTTRHITGPVTSLGVVVERKNVSICRWTGAVHFCRLHNKERHEKWKFSELAARRKGTVMKKESKRQYFSACTTRRTWKMKVYVTCCWLKKGPAWKKRAKGYTF